jgi:hypothetical protein
MQSKPMEVANALWPRAAMCNTPVEDIARVGLVVLPNVQAKGVDRYPDGISVQWHSDICHRQSLPDGGKIVDEEDSAGYK